MPIAIRKPSRAEAAKWVARFKDILEVTTGLPDMDIEGYRRGFLSVLGFDQPDGEKQVSPTGSAVVPAINNVGANFGCAFVRAEPGQGVMMHVHDTNETFMVVEGMWRVTWEGDKGDESIDLEPYDFISFPPNVQRRFQCMRAPQGKDKGLLLGILNAHTSEGTPAAVEWSPEAQKIIDQHEKKKIPA